jgi:murein DD-endopeptidase MepM/ murein hydrolase activator NlpD
VVYRARNDGPTVATVRLTFEFLQNLRPDAPLPIERVVEPGQNVVLVTLTRRQLDTSLGARPVAQIDLGSAETEPDPDEPYRIPFGGAEPRELVGGYGSPTHLAENFYALDFSLPEGTPILAARGGIVVEVQDGNTRSGLRPDLLDRANVVAIAHSDGTLATYGHLLPGIPVSIGDTVRTGQRIGLSGSTGFSGRPHLHFHLGKFLLGGGLDHTIPVTLVDEQGIRLEIIEGRLYPPSVELEVRTRGGWCGSYLGLLSSEAGGRESGSSVEDDG